MTSAVNPLSSRLDPRYSDPAAQATSWAETERVLAQAQLFWLTTVRADGRPHMTPVAAAWGGGAVHFHTGTEEQKYLNLVTNQNVVLSTGCSTWDRGLDVIVEGLAVQVTDTAALAGVVGLWADKWDGRWKLAAVEGEVYNTEFDVTSRLFTVVPSRVFAHAKGDPFGATTHRF